MAKRAEQQTLMAEDRAAKVPIRTLKQLKVLELHLSDIRRVREIKPDKTEGRVIKQVHVLHGTARVAGRQEAIEADIDIEAGDEDDWGLAGEIDHAVKPAIEKFLETVKAAHRKDLKEAAAPLGDGPPPLPSERPAVSEVKREQGRALHAAEEAGRRAKSGPTTPPPEQFADEKGGEA